PHGALREASGRGDRGHAAGPPEGGRGRRGLLAGGGGDQGGRGHRRGAGERHALEAHGRARRGRQRRGSMKLSQDLQITLTVAVSERSRLGHEYTGLEHVLSALTFDAETARVLAHAGADVKKVRDELAHYLEDEVEPAAKRKRNRE